MAVDQDATNGQLQDPSNGHVAGPLTPAETPEDRAAAELKAREQLDQLKSAAKKKAEHPAERGQYPHPSLHFLSHSLPPRHRSPD